MIRLGLVLGASLLLGALAAPVLAQDEPVLPEEREQVPLKEAVKRVVSNSEVMENLVGGEDDTFVQGAGMDSTDVTSGLLDDALLAPDPYYYESLGRRDPFVSLVMEDESTKLDLGPNTIWVVGILWGGERQVRAHRNRRWTQRDSAPG